MQLPNFNFIFKLFITKKFCVINFRGFGHPRKYVTTNYFQTTVYPLVEMTHIEIGCNNPFLAEVTQ